MTEPIALYGLDLWGNPMPAPSRGPLAERFVFPPFSVLDARSGDWQDRKRRWLDLGIKSEVGRDNDLLMNGAAAPPGLASHLGRQVQVSGKNSVYTGIGPNGKHVATGEVLAQGGLPNESSVFDPVLCELAYRWFCPPGGQVVDPFAGGSVRGVVASKLGRAYWGSDLRAEQIAANRAQIDQLCDQPRPEYVEGDSLETLDGAPLADFLFSCPPYGDLERYSDDPRDLSAQEWHTFSANYRRIVMHALRRLRPNRFACFVVGDFRDPRGFYRNFVSETIHAFTLQGAKLYNEAILVTAVGSASMRAGKQFAAGRKFVKTHQNVLIFCKGDWRAAAAACGTVDVAA